MMKVYNLIDGLPYFYGTYASCVAWADSFKGLGQWNIAE